MIVRTADCVRWTETRYLSLFPSLRSGDADAAAQEKAAIEARAGLAGLGRPFPHRRPLRPLEERRALLARVLSLPETGC